MAGRPTSYKPEYDELVYKYCLLGLTDARIAELFDIAESTLNKWKLDYPSFSEALNNGRDKADSNVTKSLYERAMGYEHPSEEIKMTKDGEIIRVPTVKKYPPDSTAMIFWLKNRQKLLWRERQEIEHSGTIERTLSDEQLDAIITRATGKTSKDN